MKACMWDRFLTLLFPHKCFLCGAVVPGEAWLCADCRGKGLPCTNGTLCRACGKRRDQCLCGRLEGGYVRASAPLYYTDEVAHGIHRYKYDGRKYYARLLVRLMEKQVREDYSGIEFDFITYVPMHRRKQRQRGFCQTELLARGLSRQLGIPAAGGILYHTGKGGAQMEQKGMAARVSNAGKSFRIRDDAHLKDRTILLVDDVLTTCATAHKCASLLMERGTRAVYVITAATTRLARL